MSSTDTINRRPAGMCLFILIALVLHIPLFVYPVLRLGSWFELDFWLTAMILLPVVSSQTISRTLLRNAKHRGKRFARHIADFLLGVSPILVMALLIAEVLVLFSLLEPLAAAQLTLVVTAGVAAFGLVMAMSPMVKTISLVSVHLKAPLRFVQITDVHIGSRNMAFLERIVARINAVDPDFVCITGDFIDASSVSVETISPLSRLSCPVFFSLGNHERYEDLPDIIERLESLGVEVLRTRSRDFRDDVQVIGIDDRDDALQVQRELDRLQVAGDRFTILMYHRPRGLEAAAAAGVDLMISGHTHNGQIFPFNLVVNGVFDQVEGLYESGSTHLYVSQGTGTWGPVMRVGTRSEITLFDIKAHGPG